MPNLAIKIGIVGDQGTGKSSLIKRILLDTYNEVQLVSGVAIDFAAKKNYECDNEIFDLHFMDFAGLAKNNDLIISLLGKVDRIALALDLRDEKMWQNDKREEYLKYWFQKIQDHSREGTPVLIVGTKCDSDFQPQRANEIIELRTDLNRTHGKEFIETSAQDRLNIDKFIDKLVVAGARTQPQKLPLDNNQNPIPSCWEKIKLYFCCCCHNQAKDQDAAPYTRQNE